MLLADATTLPSLWRSTWPVPVVLIVILIASVLVFRHLAWRWTQRRKWLELVQWAESNKLKIAGEPNAVVIPELATITRPRPTATITLTSDAMHVATMQTRKEERTDSSQLTRWHVIVRRINASWPPTGLRPVARSSSFLDLFPLSSFPSMAPPERFVIFGTESAPARRIAKSSLMALLPPDLGLLLHGSTMILDFTGRPFDPIELSRLLALVEQLHAHVPALE